MTPGSMRKLLLPGRARAPAPAPAPASGSSVASTLQQTQRTASGVQHVVSGVSPSSGLQPGRLAGLGITVLAEPTRLAGTVIEYGT